MSAATPQPPRQPELEFPVTCGCKVIGLDRDNLAADIASALQGFGVAAKPIRGQGSRGGKYVTYEVTVTFQDLDSMRRIHHVLGQIPGVKMVL